MPKAVLSDALKEVLSDLDESKFNTVEWVRPKLAVDNPLADAINRFEAENKLLEIFSFTTLQKFKRSLLLRQQLVKKCLN